MTTKRAAPEALLNETEVRWRLHSRFKYRNNAAIRRRLLEMPEHFHDENDLKLMREMRKLAPDDFNAWLGLNNIIGRENGAIPKKYRELIAIAVSATTQCPYCMEAHAKAAHAAGATREEVVEASLIAAALRAGAAATHGTMALKFFDKQGEQKKE
jgi:AhpD family alkylhydroperoxidase